MTVQHCPIALALANPPEPRVARAEPHESYKDVERLTGRVMPGEEGYTAFGYRQDPFKYDTGHVIIVSYKKNEEEPDCIENAILDCEDDPDGFFNPRMFFHTILPRLHLASFLVRITFKTVYGQPAFTYDPPDPDAFSYPLLPPANGLPLAPISALRKLDWQLCHSHIDVVSFEGNQYAFHNYSTPPAEHLFIHGYDVLLRDVELITRFNSPSLLSIAFIVSDDAYQHFRGYLVPFCPGGTLQDVLREYHIHADYEEPREDDEIMEGPYAGLQQSMLPASMRAQPKPSSREISFPLKDQPYTKALPWALKRRWAIDILRGVVALHSARCYTGDLKLENVLLARDGSAILIDITPVTNTYTEDYVPPELDVVSAGEDEAEDLPLTSARDVFAVGIMLWVLSEEVTRFTRDDVRCAPLLVWKDGVGAAPSWYRVLAESCVQLDPAFRPSAQHVLDVLEANAE